MSQGTNKTLYKHLRVLVVALLSILLLTSCNQQDIAEDLNQKQAHEIIALLNSYGITAESQKGRGSNATFAVSVRSSHYQQSVSLLHEKNLPSPTEPSFEDLIAQKGFIPNSKEIESLRLDHAMAREIEEVLENHPEIISTKAIVRLNFLEVKDNAGASLVVQTKEGSRINSIAIRQIASGILPGIDQERINISVSTEAVKNTELTPLGVKNENGTTMAVPLVPFFIWLVPEAELGSMIIILCILLALAVSIGLFLGYLLVYFRKSKLQDSSTSDTNILLGVSTKSSRQLPEV